MTKIRPKTRNDARRIMKRAINRNWRAILRENGDIYLSSKIDLTVNLRNRLQGIQFEVVP